jgi:hypothetical protein
MSTGSTLTRPLWVTSARGVLAVVDDLLHLYGTCG